MHACTLTHTCSLARGQLGNAVGPLKPEGIQGQGQLHHRNPIPRQTLSLASETRKLSPNSAPWQSHSNDAPRDKRSRHPSEDRQRVFSGNQQIAQRVSTDPGEKNILLAELHPHITHHFRRARPHTLWDLLFLKLQHLFLIILSKTLSQCSTIHSLTHSFVPPIKPLSPTHQAFLWPHLMMRT